MNRFSKIALLASVAGVFAMPTFAQEAQTEINGATLTCSDYMAMSSTDQLRAMSEMMVTSTDESGASATDVATSTNPATQPEASSAGDAQGGNSATDPTASATDTATTGTAEMATTDGAVVDGSEGVSAGDAQGGNATTATAQAKGGTAGATDAPTDGAMSSEDMNMAAMSGCAGMPDKLVKDAVAGM